MNKVPFVIVASFEGEFPEAKSGERVDFDGGLFGMFFENIEGMLSKLSDKELHDELARRSPLGKALE